MKKILTLIALLNLGFDAVNAQSIPNAGFENWTNAGSYSNPDGWDQLNSYTSLAGVYTCEQGTPGAVGSSYLKLTSKTVTGVGVVPGVAVSGVIDVTTQQAKSGFAYTGQPEFLTGKWQHMIFGTSQGFINVKLTKWNSTTNTRTTVANGNVVLTGMAMSWANFSIPMGYIETFAPDSCIITMSASGSTPANNDYLWVDDLTFTGNVASFQNIVSDNSIKLYPNPASELINLDLSTIIEKNVQIAIYDMIGNRVLLENTNSTASIANISISNLAKGNYLLNVISGKEIHTVRFSKN